MAAAELRTLPPGLALRSYSSADAVTWRAPPSIAELPLPPSARAATEVEVEAPPPALAGVEHSCRVVITQGCKLLIMLWVGKVTESALSDPCLFLRESARFRPALLVVGAKVQP